jgi:hypothetical protein
MTTLKQTLGQKENDIGRIKHSQKKIAGKINALDGAYAHDFG